MRTKLIKRKPQKLLYLKLKKKKVKFTKEESIDLIIHCTKENQKKVPIKEKDLVIFVGNTGSGKSTLINYVLNCDFKLKKVSEREKNILKDEVIEVKKKSEGGKRDEIMKIGHSVISSTFKPELIFDEKSDLIMMDCAGFEDNRGEEINISNGVNILNIISEARNVKLVIVIHFLSFFNDRAKCFDNLLKNCSKFFKNENQFQNLKDSLILVISNCPQNFNMNKIKNFFENNDNKLIKSLTNRIFAYHPLDYENEFFLKREDILKEIQNCQNIPNPKNIFENVLTNEDLIFLLNLGTSFNEIIFNNLENGNFLEAAQNFQNFIRLKIINHQFLIGIFDEIEKKIIFYLKEIEKKINNYYLLNNFEDAEKELVLFENNLKYFNKEIQNIFDIKRLKEKGKNLQIEFQKKKIIFENLKTEKEKFDYKSSMIEIINKNLIDQNEKEINELNISLKQKKIMFEKNKKSISHSENENKKYKDILKQQKDLFELQKEEEKQFFEIQKKLNEEHKMNLKKQKEKHLQNLKSMNQKKKGSFFGAIISFFGKDSTKALGKNLTKTVGDNVTKAIEDNVTKVIKVNANNILGENITKVLEDNVTKVVGDNVTKALGDKITEVLEDKVNKIIDDNVSEVPGDNFNKVLGDKVTKLLGDNITKVLGDNVTKVLGDNVNKVLGDNVNKVLGDNVNEKFIAKTEEFKKD